MRGSQLSLDICGPRAGVLPQTCKLFQLAGHFSEILSALCGICGPHAWFDATLRNVATRVPVASPKPISVK
jgi:hypothetical protein